MSTYRFLSYDLRTNAAREELPLSVKDFGGALNGIGLFTAELPVTSNTAALLAAATIPERTIVYVDRDGVLIDGYIIWARTRQPDQPLRLQGASLPSILYRNRIITDALTYPAPGTDQFTIARAIVNHMQSQAGGNVGINTGSGASGVIRERTYYGYERKNIGEALSQLSAVENGFDWAIDISWVADVPTKNLTLSYPRRGRIAGSTGIVFETQKNILDYTFLEDGSRSARTVDAFGSGDGQDMLISTSTDTALIDAGYPVTADSVSHKDVKIKATLDAHALSARRARASTPTFLTLTVDPDDIDAGLGHWIVGDDALVQITDDNFPLQADGSPGYRAYHRIIAWRVKVPDTGKDTLEVTLGPIIA